MSASSTMPAGRLQLLGHPSYGRLIGVGALGGAMFGALYFLAAVYWPMEALRESNPQYTDPSYLLGLGLVIGSAGGVVWGIFCAACASGMFALLRNVIKPAIGRVALLVVGNYIGTAIGYVILTAGIPDPFTWIGGVGLVSAIGFVLEPLIPRRSRPKAIELDERTPSG